MGVSAAEAPDFIHCVGEASRVAFEFSPDPSSKNLKLHPVKSVQISLKHFKNPLLFSKLLIPVKFSLSTTIIVEFKSYSRY